MMAPATMRTFASAVISLAFVAIPAIAPAAPDPSPSDRETARVLADKGAELFDAGKYEEAIDYFKKADGLVHAPTFVLMIAQAHAKQGKLLEARKHYQEVLDWPLTKQAPPRFAEAQKTARAEIESLNKRIPTIELAIIEPGGAKAEGARVEIDGKPIDNFSTPVPVNPGEHTIVVFPKSGASISKKITLAEETGEHVEIAVAGAPKADNASAKGSIVPALIAFGVGAAGLGVGGVTGAMALSKIGTIKDQCAGNVCPKSLEGDANSAGTLADISTIGFIVGGVGVAAGVVLLVLRPGGGSETEAQGTAHSVPRRAGRSPWISEVQVSAGPGSLLVNGRF